MGSQENLRSRIQELRAENNGDFSRVLSTLISEGYDPEHIVMWAGDELTLS